MTAPARPRRSMLYMPAANARLLEKAKGLPADGLIFDLEDAVAPDAKPAARKAAVAAAKTGGYAPREVLIRVNGLDTKWAEDDLEAAAESGADGIVLPKVNSAADIRAAAKILDAVGAPENLLIWTMMEMPRGILAAAEVAQVNDTLPVPRMAGFLVGTADLAKDLRCAHPADRAPMAYALQHCIMAARAHGVYVLDGVHVDLNDEEGFVAACKYGRDLGFDGKTLIHPKQIAVANAAYAPAPEELDRARRIIAAHKEAAAEGRGVTTLDGKLVEVLHVAEAERLLAQAETIAALEERI